MGKKDVDPSANKMRLSFSTAEHEAEGERFRFGLVLGVERALRFVRLDFDNFRPFSAASAFPLHYFKKILIR